MVYTPPKYPGAIPTITDLPNYTDDVSWVKAYVLNDIKKELRAALIELGVNPKGAYADVAQRLNATPIPIITTFGTAAPNGILVPDSGSITCDTDYLCTCTKIGTTVICHGRATVSAISSPTGGVYITLPYASKSGQGPGSSVGPLIASNISFTGNYLAMWLGPATAYLDLMQITAAGGLTFLDASNISTASFLIFCITYSASS